MEKNERDLVRFILAVSAQHALISRGHMTAKTPVEIADEAVTHADAMLQALPLPEETPLSGGGRKR